MSETIAIPFQFKPDWVDQSETFFAINHYKKPIPYVLKAGSVIRLSSNYSCTVCLLNNDNKTEQIVDNVLDEVFLEVEKDSVAFINTIFVDNSDGSLRVEYVIEGEHEPLVHVMCGSENAYPEGVDETQSLVFVEGRYIQLLVPHADLAHLNNHIKQDPTLAPIDDFYTDVVEFYDDLTGIAFQRKYFARADMNGGGGAYYSRLFMGESSASMRSFFLRPTPLNWGCLHEISHSLDMHFAHNNAQVSLGEVWTNIFPDFYQYSRLTPSEYQASAWIMGSSQQAVWGNLIAKFHTSTVHDWNLRERLIYLVQFFYKVGHKRMLTIMYDHHARLIDSGEFILEEFRVIDLIIKISNDFNIDVVHINRLVKVNLLDDILYENVKCNFDGEPCVYEFLLKPNSISWALINSDESVRSDVSLIFSTEIPQTIYGAQFIFMKNKNSFIFATFSRQHTFRYPAVVAGVYKFFHETGLSTRRYKCDLDYFVHDGGPIFINILRYNDSALLNDRFLFLGLGNVLCATLDADYANRKIVFDIKRQDPHVYFANEIYFSVSVEGVFNWQVLGANNESAPQVLEAILQRRRIITIYHREFRNRLVSNFSLWRATNSFYVTDLGLAVMNSDNDIDRVADRLASKIVNAIDYITQTYPGLNAVSPPIQDYIYLAYRLLPPQQRNDLYDTVADFLPETNVTTISVLGSGHENFFYVRERHGQLLVQTFDNYKSFGPHFTYVSFEVRRSHEIIFSLAVSGEEPPFATTQTIELLDNDIMHITTQGADGRMIVVINGELEQTNSNELQYRWKAGKFIKSEGDDDDDDDNIIMPVGPAITLMVAIGAILFFIAIILFLLLRVTKAQKTLTSIPEKSAPIDPLAASTQTRRRRRKIIE
ncbi:vef-1 [Agrotis segetum nucleopolyhedrovirus B]|uniref:Vef-1 n=1 Tax=Agrotis segetum nucleopolyhedrovirus B TaxID=1580580 RepID=A0A0A7KR59_9ABAC|nr:vef-1 [Agrotis segetum nucleopolyhedrovirus B]AIZ48629.1 vef-1 [Agrotis segetum nucleopolyhedrovirus B]